ncbi:short chain dehydrogenase (plasmid) [Fulvitalea axinellae]|uniref:Short chain dehydrogenase n=1 Tax=Fulvitalea axinellae TaxID=1182444 RepID=A0AAU9D2R7_9BACT|nr:short chain dehydrogenase [Fulvitalea axinellae]
MKKLVLVGSTGIIGREIVKLLGERYEIVEINRSSGDYKVDMQDTMALDFVFEAIGGFDVLISASGDGKWGKLSDLSIQDFHDGLNSKLMGQVNLVMIGRKYANYGASFILTTGVLAHKPVVGGLTMTMINLALEGFVKGAAVELEDGMTINAISPSFAKETMELLGIDPKYGVPAMEFAGLYEKALDEGQTGRIYEL